MISDQLVQKGGQRWFKVTKLFSGLVFRVYSCSNTGEGTLSDSVLRVTVFELRQQWWSNEFTPRYPSTHFPASHWLNLKEYLTSPLKEMKGLCFCGCVSVCVCVYFGDSLESIPIASNANTMWAFRLSHLSTGNIAKGKLPYSPGWRQECWHVFGRFLNILHLDNACDYFLLHKISL